MMNVPKHSHPENTKERKGQGVALPNNLGFSSFKMRNYLLFLFVLRLNHEPGERLYRAMRE